MKLSSTQLNKLPSALRPTNLFRRSNTLNLSFYSLLKILYVEDNILNQEIAKQVFKRLGPELKLANDGFQALDMIVKQRLDFIFMDIDMPGLNGYETTNIIRGSLCLSVPIIALTSKDSEDDIYACMVSGMNDHLSKPLNQEQLHHSLYKWINRN